jgi:hypothetical protein
MTSQPSDAEIWAEVLRLRQLAPEATSRDSAMATALVEVFVRATVCGNLSVEPDRVRDVIAMRATPIGF